MTHASVFVADWQFEGFALLCVVAMYPLRPLGPRTIARRTSESVTAENLRWVRSINGGLDQKIVVWSRTWRRPTTLRASSTRLRAKGPIGMTDKIEITWHEQTVQRPRGCVVWFTGLSGSGKSTISNGVDAKLHALRVPSFVLDGDNIRHGLNASAERLAKHHDAEFAKRFGLGFSAQDREENIRRIGAVAEIMCSAGLIVLTAFVSPYRRDRDLARLQVEGAGEQGDFAEVLVDTPIDVCESRDPKGLYKKARAGEIKGFTGIDDPYEAPDKPELILPGGSRTPDELANDVIDYLRSINKMPPA